jgi:N-acetylglucosaminyl-diphospho-decaprenol L-rhamnosyltransferase
MGVSVIVSNFNGARWLPRLLDTLHGQRDVDLQIIVVDRCSSDGSAEILARHPGVQVLTEPPASGLVSGYAAGVPAAVHEHLFFCNEDMWFDPGCLRALEALINLPARICAADPWQWTYDGREWIHGGVRFRPSRWAASSPHPRHTYDFTVPLRAGERVPFPCAGAFLMHRAVYDELGGWDRGFFLDHEDIELFLRAWQRGWHCVTQPDARVHHAVGASNAQTLGPQLSVSRRRYCSARSSIAIIAAKYYSARALPWIPLVWLAMLGNNLAKRRFKLAGGDLRVLGEIARRLPAALRFRRANGEWNRLRPGERFFREPAFCQTA